MRGSGGSCFEGEGLAVRDLDVDPETLSLPCAEVYSVEPSVVLFLLHLFYAQVNRTHNTDLI